MEEGLGMVNRVSWVLLLGGLLSGIREMTCLHVSCGHCVKKPDIHMLKFAGAVFCLPSKKMKIAGSQGPLYII